MKAMTFALAFAFSAQVLAAATLIKSETHVGFAPPEYRGTFTSEIKTDGTIQYVNNKGVVTKMGKLSSLALKNLKAEIATIKDQELVGNDDGPMCMDAPSIIVTAVVDGKEIVAKETVGCKDKVNSSAWDIIPVIEAASTLCHSLLK
jgi:hypothetical protein